MLNVKFLIAFIGYDGVEFFKVMCGKQGSIRFNVRDDFSDVWKVRQMPLGELGRSKVPVECSPSTSIIVYGLSYLAALFSPLASIILCIDEELTVVSHTHEPIRDFIQLAWV